MADSYRDFIPAGEDPGALGSGFKDFVPAPKPVRHEVVETPAEVETPEMDPKKK